MAINKLPNEIQQRYLKYVDDMDDVMYSNPNFRFYIGFDNQQLMFRLYVRNAMHLDNIVKHFREVDQSSFFTGQREPTYHYSVSPFGFFPTGMLFEVLNFLVSDFEMNPMHLTTNQLVFIGAKAKSYVYDYLVPLAKKTSELKYNQETFEVDNISMDRAEDPEDPNVRVLRPYQDEAIKKIIFKGNGRCLVQAATSCHAKGTNLLLMDGSIKKVEDICVGDKLVGDDGTPRTVLELRRGQDMMYKITPIKHNGSPFIVNGNHKLTLVLTSDPNKERRTRIETHELTKYGYVTDITVNDYLKQTNDFKHLHKLFKSNSEIEFHNEFQNNNYFISPYLMGLILGDGCVLHGCNITTIDKEIRDVIYEESSKLGMHIRESKKQKTDAKTYHFLSEHGTSGKNEINNELKRLGLFGHKSETKFIPDCYKYGSIEARKQVLAGLMDTDGSSGDHAFDIILKSKQLIEDIAFIARSLGMSTNVRSATKTIKSTGFSGVYWRCSLMGKNTENIPVRLARKSISRNATRVNQLRCGFTVEEVGMGDYYGFVLDGNHRYVMADDGFVTHNSGKSFIIANLIYTLKNQYFKDEEFRTLIYVPSIQLVSQFYKDLLEYGYTKDEICMFSGSTKKKDMKHLSTASIVIANSTYCLQHIAEIGKIDMVVGDEAHKTLNYGTAGFSVLENYMIETKLRIGFSGTLPKGFKFYQMEGLTGPKVVDVTVTELQDQGFISKCSFTKLNIDIREVTSNRELLFHPNSIYKVNSMDETGMGLVGSGDPYRAEVKFMVEKCEKLFQPALDYLMNNTTTNDNTIVLFDRTEMGERLFNHLDLLHERGEINRIPLFLDGSVKLEERERIRKYAEENTGCILLGQSAILSTGINIKSLSKLVLLVGGKAAARTIQSIGRILRLKEGKQAEVIDCVFNTKYGKRHFSERKRLYKEYYDLTKFDKEVDVQI